ncbi:DUF72 domain-containing protein [bacterium]|nr:DUF72 domain-containing protein [bacterium]MBU1984700.1 DUF72 domain-containing protein [bacterium]
MQRSDINIGTSGWKFDDWAGTFYPFRVPKTKWLEYYAARFPVGEINSTYYRIAPLSVYAAIARRTPDGFRLFAKVHAEVTHTRKDPASSLRMLIGALHPLSESGRLIGLLAQFPASFRFIEENIGYVLALPGMCRDARLCVEFRHASWLCDEAIESVRKAEMTWVTPDEPKLTDLLPFRIVATSDIVYIRLHGRNNTTWYDPQAGNRYDYNYSEPELAEIGSELLHSTFGARKGYVLFNNCHLGQAPLNAQWMKMWLAAESNGYEMNSA